MGQLISCIIPLRTHFSQWWLFLTNLCKKKPSEIIIHESPPINFETDDEQKSHKSTILEDCEKLTNTNNDTIMGDPIISDNDKPECIGISKKKEKPIKMIQSSERYTELKKLCENLQIIANIKENEKLWLENDILAIDTSWVPIWARWKYGQSREIIIPFVAKIITTGSLDENIEFAETYEIFIKLISGINIIKKMYPEKEIVLDSLANIVDNIINMY